MGWLGKLRKDERGTTLAMMAAALIPVAGMIGSGLDMSRAYMAKAKLQNACDAAALAARRHMADELTEASKVEGRKFFYFNFPQNTMGSATVVPNIRVNPSNASEVMVTAATTVPTSVMQLFGKETIAIEAECDADQDFVNNDIMIVLDVTMSMNCTAGTNCNYAASEQTNSRLSRLRTGVAGLYRALSDAEGVRTRYGIVPYSMTVNTGRPILALNSNYIRNPADYWYQETYCNRWDSRGQCNRTAQRWSKRNPSVNHNSTWFSSWAGCIEERSTISQNGQNEIRISTDVTKADIDTVSASDNKLKWQPYDANTTTASQGYSDGTHANLASFCPATATRLTEYSSESGFQTAVNAALARVGGYTNHDVGIMWAMRYLSSTGMFAADNPREWRVGSGPLMPVEKHIVFMTDGQMSAPANSYSSFGHHAAEQRLVGAGTDEVGHHQTRFMNACRLAERSEEAGGHGITIWVIAVDVGSTGEISPCSGSGHFYVSNGSDLEQIFELIGKGIGKLRITK